MIIENREDPSYVGTINFQNTKDRDIFNDLNWFIMSINRDDPKIRRSPLRKIVLKKYKTDIEVSRLHAKKVDIYLKFM